MNSTAITSVTATHLYGSLRFEQVKQDRRVYYRLLLNGKGTGSLTDARHARETIAYWQRRGWVK